MDFERIALSSAISLELHTEVVPWKKCLMEVRSFGTVLHVTISIKVTGIGVNFTLMLESSAMPGSVCRRQNNNYFNAHLKEILKTKNIYHFLSICKQSRDEHEDNGVG